MDIQKTACEIGLFETALNLSFVLDSTDVKDKVGTLMPLPSFDVRDRIEKAAEWLLSFGKRKYMFLTPEIALVEAMIDKSERDFEIIFAVPANMETEAKNRLQNNLPKKIVITILEEPFFPTNFLPGNGMIIATGYTAGGHDMVFADTYRLIEHYNGFLGRKVFLPYVEISSAYRYDNWLEVNQKNLNLRWRV